MSHDVAPRVAVFGAGIAGLTAAHELIERGFRVRVYEPTAPGPNERTCGIGGMARTQYSRVELPRDGFARGLPAEVAPHREQHFVRATPLTDAHAELRALRIPFPDGKRRLSPDAANAMARAKRLLAEEPARVIWVRGYTDDPALHPDLTTLYERPRTNRPDYALAEFVANELGAAAGRRCRLWPVAFGYGHPRDHRKPDADRRYVEFWVAEDLLPGEHGFRFFPSFYRHVFDTMRRIPLARDPVGGPFVESGRTVDDNLVSTTSQGIAYRGARPFAIPRRLPRTLHELLDANKRSLAESGLTAADAALLNLKVFKYATSCTRRREREYEHQSWWEFLEGHRYSPRCQKYIDSSPQMLVAMRAKQSDARTIGNIVVQLMLDQLRHGENTDRTMRGPTTVMWFAPWRRYLERQGVEFVRGRLLGYEQGPGGGVAIVRQAPSPTERDETAWERKAILFDYYVVALPAGAAQQLVNDTELARCAECAKIGGLQLGAPHLAQPGGHVEHMSGIQFYLRSEISFVQGHMIYPDSEWGLSSIAQPQFWTHRRGWWDGYRGLLSVDIGNWYEPSRRTGKTAWQSTPDEIADEVWRQITQDLDLKEPPEKPLYYHLDDNIELGPDDRPVGNRTPMLINRTGAYRRRAGRPHGYHLHDRQLVFAGTHLQTYTRLTTMEAANESARHAVCAILDAEDFRGDDPMIEDPERHEFEDLGWLVAIDERLADADLPHVFDIVGEETVLRAPLDLADRLRRAGADARPEPARTKLRITRGRRRESS